MNKKMEPIRLDDYLKTRKIKIDPAFKEITEGLSAEIKSLLEDLSRLSISCCIEGCCVSWCCIQIV